MLFLVTEDWYFASHRLPLARAVRDQGVEVYVMTHLNGQREALEAEGFRVIPWKTVVPRSTNVFREARSLWEVFRAYRRVRPDLVHHIALKPSVYGAFVALFLRRISSVQTVAGLGYLFTNPPRKLRPLRWLLVAALRLVLRGDRSRTIFQNPDDRDFFERVGLVRKNDSRLIRGSGVNMAKLVALPEPDGIPVVTLSARMLWDKGVGEFVEAATRLQREGVQARFVLAGRLGGPSRGSISEKQLDEWAAAGIVEWWGFVDDIRSLMAKSTIICLPSYYREGVPKILIEAASCGRAIVTTDSPGCRDVVRDGENGFLVPPRDALALEKTIRLLLDDSELRSRMARQGRKIAELEFSEELVIRETMGVYNELMGDRWPDAAPGRELARAAQAARTSS